MNIENFIPKYLGEVRNFCVENLAGVLYMCVEHDEPRTEIDWLTSEDYIRKFRIGIFEDLTKKFLVLTAYEEFRKETDNFPEIVKDHHWKVSSTEVDKIKEKIVFLNNQKFSDLVNISHEKRKSYQKLFLGRDVWDLFYQNMWQDNYKNPENNLLKSNGYTKIIFG